MPLNESELTHDEQIELALKVMADGPRRDLEAGRKWINQRQRIIRIKERECLSPPNN